LRAGQPAGPWGFYSFPLFERIKAQTPQFEDLTAFQTFVGRMSVRRQGVAEAPRPLRTMYATGSYFKTLGVGAFAGRVFTADDDRAAATPVAVMAYNAWQGLYGGDGSVVGSTLMIEGHPFTVAGIAPPGFFGETLRADPPDLWLPLQHEPLISGADTSLLRQPVSAWLRVIGRLRADATIDGMDARLTVFLHQWMRSEAGYPANFMPEIERRMSENVITVVPAGGGVGVMKEQYGRSLRILLVVCGMVLLIACANVANLLLARAVARRGQNRRTPRPRRISQTNRRRCADGKRHACDCRRSRRARRRDRCGSIATVSRLCRRDDAPDRRHAFTSGARLRGWPGVDHRRAVRCRAGVVCHSDESDRGASSDGTIDGRRRIVHPHDAAGRTGSALGGTRRRFDDARSQPGQPRRAGLWLQSQRPRAGRCWPAIGRCHG
jgi:hypothetical protein